MTPGSPLSFCALSGSKIDRTIIFVLDLKPHRILGINIDSQALLACWPTSRSALLSSPYVTPKATLGNLPASSMSWITDALSPESYSWTLSC